MFWRQRFLVCCLLFAGFAWLGLCPALAPATPQDAPQASAQAPAAAPGSIKVEANLVVVDVIATDKKGNYIRDLEAKDLHVFEDGKEQVVTSFSPPADPNAPAGPAQRRYIVLFFDNSTMVTADQARARQAAAQFIEKTASESRLIAIADFAGSFRIAQNFTANVDALKQAVGGVKFSAMQANERGQSTQLASMGAPSMVQVRTDYAARSSLLAIRSLAKTLAAVPGRKTVILFSGGFALNTERESELSATIDAANKANVAIYPVDVRGLSGLSPEQPPAGLDPERRQQFPGFPPGAELRDSLFPHEPRLLAALLGAPDPQVQPPSGGGGPTGGSMPSPGAGGTGGSGGGFGGGTPSPGGAPPGAGGRTPAGPTSPGGAPPGGGRPGTFGPGRVDTFGRSGYETYPQRSIIPPMMESVSTNQQVLYALAAGTGGFTIFNTNDFTGPLLKVAKELEEYYVLGYVPPNQIHDGSYHRIEVKVDRKGVKLRARTGYYDVKSPDLLAGKPEGKVLEEQAANPQPGEIPVTLGTPHFYTSANVARVNLVLQIPANTLDFEKLEGKFHSKVNVLGIAYREDGAVAARFSDTVKLDLEKKDLKDFSKGPFTYRNTFNIAPGTYKLKVVLSGGGRKFGKYEKALEIEPFDGKQFHLSALALSNSLRPVSEIVASLDAALLEERTPLVAQGIEVIPSSTNRFSRTEKVGLYVEVYEPLMQESNVPRVGIIMDFVDPKTNQRVYSSNTILVNSFAQQGNPVIPIGVMVPVEKLQVGNYRLDVRARDSAGNVSPVHSAEFVLD